jgi:hypothetical protein
MWHYCIMRHFDSKKNPYYEIHEYYTMGGHRKNLWTESNLVPMGETVKELKSILRMMYKDVCRREIRDYKTGRIIKKIK